MQCLYAKRILYLFNLAVGGYTVLQIDNIDKITALNENNGYE